MNFELPKKYVHDFVFVGFAGMRRYAKTPPAITVAPATAGLRHDRAIISWEISEAKDMAVFCRIGTVFCFMVFKCFMV